MEIQEFIDRKKKLERDIYAEVNSLLINFRVETKFSPDSINIYLVEATALGEQNKCHIVADCDVHVDLS